MKDRMNKFRKRLEEKISLPDDTENDRQRKVVALGIALTGIFGTAVWSVILFEIGLSALGLLLLLAFSVLVLNVIFLLTTRQFRVFLTIELAVGLIVPFVVQFLLGGFALSGFVSLWALPSIMGAAIYINRQSAYRWLLAFIALTILSAAFEGIARTLAPEISNIVRTIIFAWNGIIIGSIIFLAVQTILRETEAARGRADTLLLNILPKEIATILKHDDSIIADHYDEVSILFADVVNFTPLSAKMAPVELVGLLNELFSQFDLLVERYGLEKIKTIGDCYMVAAGVPRPRADHAIALANLALDMRDCVGQNDYLGQRLSIRIGLNSGSVVAGVIGRKKFIYDLWGDAVNVASRMESHGIGGVVQITEAAYDRIGASFICEPQGVINIKGKGDMQTWHVVSRRAV
jgi:adenylate cyclase